MNQHPSNEVVAATTAAPTKAKVKKVVRVGSAATFTLAIFGALALPAYALNGQEQSAPAAAVAKTQSIKVTAGPALTAIDDIPLEVDTSIADQERRAREVADAEKKASERAEAAKKGGNSAVAAVDVPAGVGADGIVAAALAQVGAMQDCTVLVERALRAVGFTVGDLAPNQFAAYGPNVPYVHGETALAPGDIIIYPNNTHVAIYIGGGQAVHSGWTGGTTVIAGLNTYNGMPNLVVRMS